MENLYYNFDLIIAIKNIKDGYKDECGELKWHLIGVVVVVVQ